MYNIASGSLISTRSSTNFEHPCLLLRIGYHAGRVILNYRLAGKTHKTSPQTIAIVGKILSLLSCFGTFISESKVGCSLGSLKLFSAVLKAFQFTLFLLSSVFWKLLIISQYRPRGGANLVPRFSLLPVERPWLGLQTNDLGEGRISVRFVSTKRRRRGQ